MVDKKVKRGVKKIGKKAKEYQLNVVKQMLKLVTNSFGLVAALAWNSVITELVNDYIRPYIGKGSGIISLFIYAVLITVLVVTVTLQLTKIKESLAKPE